MGIGSGPVLLRVFILKKKATECEGLAYETKCYHKVAIFHNKYIKDTYKRCLE